ncbi:MAG: 2-oxoacid:acceptor oxidoreductase family protein, partial [Blautia sp.]
MNKEILIAGFGGQGVMSIGKSMVEAGAKEGLEVSWVPSYGPEMRGGSANCYVVLSDERIGAPVFSAWDEFIAMNTVALNKFLPNLKQEGFLFVNSDVVTKEIGRDDVTWYKIPCDRIAGELGHSKGA